MQARAGIGHNGGPPLEEEEEEDKSPPTVEEARVVGAAISYVQYKVPNLEEICTKRKGGRVLGWRHVVANCIKGRVRRNSLAVLLGNYDEKLTGESQQRPDAWAEYDEEHGTGEFGALMAQMRDAIEADSHVDAPAMDAMVKVFSKLDPQLRKLEDQKRAHEYAAAEADKAAADLESKERERKQAAKRLVEAAAIKKALKGVKGRDAIVASHLGPKQLAKTLSAEATEVVKIITIAEAKGVYRPTSQVEKKAGDAGAFGVKECLRLGLARQSQPYLAPPVDDPPLLPTELGMRVFDAAVKAGRIVLDKKRGKKDAERAQTALKELDASANKRKVKR